MTHFHHGHTCALPIEHFFAGLLQYLERQYGWARTEIKYAFHEGLVVEAMGIVVRG